LNTFLAGTTKVVHCLADTFETSSDGLRFHFTLKPGIPFQKGFGEVQASDVKFSFERIAGLTKPKLNSPYVGDWAQLESVKVEGKYSGTIIMKEVFAPTLAVIIGGGIASGMVVSEKAVARYGKHFGTKWADVPRDYLQWVVKQDMDEDILFTARTILSKR